MGQTVKEALEIVAWVVRQEDISSVWPTIIPWLMESQKFGNGEYLPEDIYMALINGTMQLTLAANQERLLGCVVTTILFYPRKKVMHVLEMGGSAPAKDWSRAILAELLNGAKTLNIDSITAVTYPVMARALRRYGFTSQATFISRNTSNENLH